MRIVIALALFKLLLHFFTAGGYGYFRDELYYIVCGLRLDWGYVDHPPLAPLLAVTGWKLFGESVFGVRFFPAVLGSINLVLASLIAREFGAGKFGQALAAFAVLVAPYMLLAGNLLTTDSVVLVFWTACAYVVARIIRRGDVRLWIWFGVFAGLGMQAKHSTLFFVFSVVLGLLLTPQRKILWNRWFLIGALAGSMLFLPNMIWQWQHNWATYELLQNVKNSAKNIVLGPIPFFLEQALAMNPVNALLWIGGLFWLLFAVRGTQFRPFALAYVVLFALLIALKGKAYYMLPIYPVLLAAGATAFEVMTAHRAHFARVIFVVFAAAVGLLLLPMVLPVLSAEKYLAYQRAIGFEPPRTERSHTAEMPQHYADRFGWQELVANVAAAYRSLPEEERAKAGIFTQNFGEAGALDILGRPHNLPPALSGHQNYYLWGTHGHTGEVLLVLDEEPGMLPEICGSVEDLGSAMHHPYAMPYENRLRIYVCRNMNPPLHQLWPKLKNWL